MSEIKFKHGDAVVIPLMDQRTGKVGKALGVVMGSCLKFGVEKVTVRHPSRNVSVTLDADVIEFYKKPEINPEKPKKVRKAVVKKEDS